MVSAAHGRVLVAGTGVGPLLRLRAPISFWGGVDPVAGTVADPRHPDHGRSLAGTVLWIPATVGSSSSSAIMLELLREGTAPAAVLLGRADAILALGAVVARELGYPRSPSVLESPLDGLEGLGEGAPLVDRRPMDVYRGPGADRQVRNRILPGATPRRPFDVPAMRRHWPDERSQGARLPASRPRRPPPDPGGSGREPAGGSGRRLRQDHRAGEPHDRPGGHRDRLGRRDRRGDVHAEGGVGVARALPGAPGGSGSGTSRTRRPTPRRAHGSGWRWTASIVRSWARSTRSVRVCCASDPWRWGSTRGSRSSPQTSYRASSATSGTRIWSASPGTQIPCWRNSPTRGCGPTSSSASS